MAVDKEFLERVYDKQETISHDVNEIKVVLAKQEENLRLHVYRTDLAEQNIELLRKQITPIEIHVKSIHTVSKYIGALAVLAGLVVTILKIVQYLIDGTIS